MTESRGLRRERNSPTRTGQRLRLPGERFPALNSLWDQELEEEKTPQCSPHPQGIPFARKSTETQLSGFHFSVPDTGFLIKKKKKERKKGKRRKGGREEGDFNYCRPFGSCPWGWQSKCPGMRPRSLPARVGRGRPHGLAIRPTEGHWQPPELAQLGASARREGGGDGLERRVAGRPLL